MNTLSRFRIVNIAKSANAGVMTGQIQTTLAEVSRTVMRTSDALIHIDAQSESGGPLVTALMAFAAYINLICPERLEVAILISVQRAFSMRYKHDQQWLGRLRVERLQGWLIARAAHMECKRACKARP